MSEPLDGIFIGNLRFDMPKNQKEFHKMSLDIGEFIMRAQKNMFNMGKQAMAKSLWEAYQSIGQVSPNMRLFSKEEALDILLEIIRKEAFGDKVLPEDFVKEVPIHE